LDTSSGNQTVLSDSVTDQSNTTNSAIPTQKKKSGLSAGSICAIVIPCIAALLGVAAAAALCKGGSVAATPQVIPSTLPNPVYVNSLDKLEVSQDIPIQQQLQPQPQPKVIEPQFTKEVIRPNYPVNKLEPPVVNKAFQPMNIILHFRLKNMIFILVIMNV